METYNTVAIETDINGVTSNEELDTKTAKTSQATCPSNDEYLSSENVTYCIKVAESVNLDPVPLPEIDFHECVESVRAAFLKIKQENDAENNDVDIVSYNSDEDNNTAISYKGIDNANGSGNEHQPQMNENYEGVYINAKEAIVLEEKVTSPKVTNEQKSKKKQHICPYCQKVYAKLSLFKIHVVTHTKNKSFQCQYCDKAFSYANAHLVHTKRHLNDKSHKCSVCDLSFTTIYELQRHMQMLKHSGERLYECDFCGKTFLRRNILNKHLRLHTGEKTHQCELCDKGYLKRADLVKHLKTHSRKEPYKCACGTEFKLQSKFNYHIRKHCKLTHSQKCELCDMTFAKKVDLEKHLKTHSRKEPYKCDACGSEFTSKWRFNDHIAKLCIHTHPHTCELCDMTFAKKGDLEKHLRKEHYKCDACGCGFTSKWRYDHHITRFCRLTHTQECELCDMTFAKKVDLEKHLKKHSKKEPYKCHACGSEFTSKWRFNDHIAKLCIHTHPHTCELCNMRFTRKVDLEEHLRKEHYKCDACGCGFTSKWKFDYHITKSCKLLPLQKCELCEMTFAKKVDLEKHITTHSKTELYKCACGSEFKLIITLQQKCELCDMLFTKKVDLEKHFKTHLLKEPYKCDACGCGFTLKWRFDDHITKLCIHTRPQNCALCGMAFDRKVDLEKHLKTHTNTVERADVGGGKAHKCELCDMAYLEEASLIRHKRYCGNKTHKCEVCGKTFLRKDALEMHLRGHTAERPHKCEHCDKAFIYEESLVKHLEVKHKL